MKKIDLPNGLVVSQVALGAMNFGTTTSEAEAFEVLDLYLGQGGNFVDTSNNYAHWAGTGDESETVLGKYFASRKCRDQVVLATKVGFDRHGKGAGLKKEQIEYWVDESLRKLQTDYIDLYLLHWRGGYGLDETFEAMERLLADGKIRAYGVSNFDLDDMQEAAQYDNGNICVNQVLYNLASRGIEWDLMPWMKQRNIAVMAYSPLYQTRLLKSPGLKRVAQELSITPAQLALAWLLHQGTVPIPKTSSVKRVEENRKAWDIELDAQVLAELDGIFPPPDHKMPLDVL